MNVCVFDFLKVTRVTSFKTVFIEHQLYVCTRVL